MTHKVYVIENLAGKLYIGVSENVSLRLEQHNNGISKWTKAKGPWKLLWTSEAMSLSEARKLENKLKRQKGGDGLLFTTVKSPPKGEQDKALSKQFAVILQIPDRWRTIMGGFSGR